MKTSAKIMFTVLFAVTVCCFSACKSSDNPYGKNFDGPVVILHTNDVHGAVEGYAAVAALKEEYKAQGAYVLLFDAGDFSQGDPTVSVSKGKSAIDLMNMAGYDAASPGNHEFDYGYDNLVELSKNAQFPILSANILYNGKKPFKPYAIFTAGKNKIGVFALDTPETAVKAHPAKIKGVTFLSGQEMFDCASEQVKTLKSKGCTTIVCVGHLGIDDESVGNRSIDLLEAVKGIDVFIDGHSHSTLDDIKKAVGGDCKVGDTVLASTGTKLANIGVITISDGELTVESKVVKELSIAPVAEVAAMASDIKKKVDDDYGTVFAKTEVVLNGDRAPGNRTEETNLGDLITDAMVWAAEKAGEKVDAAVTNGGGIRAPINAGNITKKNVNTVLPFGNTLSIVKVSGSELLEALEASTHCTPTAIGGFPQVSGIRFTVNTDKSFAEGDLYPGSTYHRPTSIQRVSIESVGNKPFDKNAIYSIATNDFMASGGDTYYAFKAASVNYDLGVPLDEVLMDYIVSELNGVITEAKYGTTDGRITVASNVSYLHSSIIDSQILFGRGSAFLRQKGFSKRVS